MLVGPTEVGKSYWARETAFPGDSQFWKESGKWWCGYTGQDTVVFDEFEGWLTFHEIKRLLDETPVQVEPKGEKLVQFVSKRIIFTSNKLPKHWWRREHYLEALYRRFQKIYYVPRLGELVECEDIAALEAFVEGEEWYKVPTWVDEGAVSGHMQH